MLTLLEQLDKGTLWPISGGIHPPEFKTLSSQSKIARLPLAEQYIVPIPHVGESCTLAVQVGSTVDKGQPLTMGEGFHHLPVHAPISGTVVAIEPRPSNHASGLSVLSCVIENDHQERIAATIHQPLNHDEVKTMSADEILTRVQQAGIAGLGGAAFPTHIKLKPVSEIELLIINGVECEPYITSDDRLMREYSNEIISGIEIINQLLNPKRIIIAIEYNKPEAIALMTDALKRSDLPTDMARVTSLPTLYPSGGEKQLIQILTGQEVPSGSIPAHLGILVQNVGTAYSIQQAVYCNAPLIERVVTLTGSNCGQAGNYWVPIGTPIQHLLQQTEFKGRDNDPVIIGGPMMGYMLPNTTAPLLKGSNCVLTPTRNEITTPTEKPCIRCGECAIACPAQLLPQQLYWHSKAEEYDKAASYNLRDCIECGCCSYVCPSDIPLVEYYRIAKSALRVEAEEKKQAELAKQRFDSRTLRLEEEKRAREEKAKQSASKRQANMSNQDKDAVAAAMARIKAKKAQQAEESASTDTTSVSPADKVAAAVARAKAKKAANQQETGSITEAKSNATESKPAPEPMTQAEKVAAAVARAKAKKAAKQQEADSITEAKPTPNQVVSEESSATLSPEESKKAKIAAAVAKAKAKKLAGQNQVEQTTSHTLDKQDLALAQAKPAKTEIKAEPALTADEIKKAKIAAAVAKAKAKKLAQTKANEQKDH